MLTANEPAKDYNRRIVIWLNTVRQSLLKHGRLQNIQFTNWPKLEYSDECVRDMKMYNVRSTLNIFLSFTHD